jgi:peroxiredoxin
VQPCEERGVGILPVVCQPRSAVKTYIEDTGFPLDILVDEDRTVAKRYGVFHGFGWATWRVARPAVFLIDREGRVRYCFVGRTQREFPGTGDLLTAIDALGARSGGPAGSG